MFPANHLRYSEQVTGDLTGAQVVQRTGTASWNCSRPAHCLWRGTCVRADVPVGVCEQAPCTLAPRRRGCWVLTRPQNLYYATLFDGSTTKKLYFISGGWVPETNLKLRDGSNPFFKGESRAFPTNPPCFPTTESHRRSSACSRGCRADSLGRGGGRQAKARSTGIGGNALGFTGLERACTAPRVVIPGVVRRARRRTPKARAPVPRCLRPRARARALERDQCHQRLR